MKTIILIISTLLMHNEVFAFTVQGKLHESVALPCEGAPHKSPYYRWQLEERWPTWIAKLTDKKVTYGENYTGRLDLYQKTGDLTIRKVLWSDVALYSCWHSKASISRHDGGLVGLSNTKIHVLIPGGSLKLKCEGMPSKPKTFEWRDGSKNHSVVASYDANTNPQQHVLHKYKGSVNLSSTLGELVLLDLTKENNEDTYLCLHERGMTTAILRLSSGEEEVAKSDSAGCGILCILLSIFAVIASLGLVAAVYVLIKKRKK